LIFRHIGQRGYKLYPQQSNASDQLVRAGADQHVQAKLTGRKPSMPISNVDKELAQEASIEGQGDQDAIADMEQFELITN